MLLSPSIWMWDLRSNAPSPTLSFGALFHFLLSRPGRKCWGEYGHLLLCHLKAKSGLMWPDNSCVGHLALRHCMDLTSSLVVTTEGGAHEHSEEQSHFTYKFYIVYCYNPVLLSMIYIFPCLVHHLNLVIGVHRKNKPPYQDGSSTH